MVIVLMVLYQHTLLSLMEESSAWLIFLSSGDRSKCSQEMGSTFCCFSRFLPPELAVNLG
jgi:hypothetical protein